MMLVIYPLTFLLGFVPLFCLSYTLTLSLGFVLRVPLHCLVLSKGVNPVKAWVSAAHFFISFKNILCHYNIDIFFSFFLIILMNQAFVFKMQVFEQRLSSLIDNLSLEILDHYMQKNLVIN